MSLNRHVYALTSSKEVCELHNIHSAQSVSAWCLFFFVVLIIFIFCGWLVVCIYLVYARHTKIDKVRLFNSYEIEFFDRVTK